MKTLSKKMLINKLKEEMGILRETNKKIEEKNITNEAHKLYTWKYLTMGAIDMLKTLINTIEE